MAPSTIGFRIYTNTPAPPVDLVRAFQGTPTGHVCDAMDRLNAMDYRIKPVAAGSQMCGPALTVRTRPGDNLMVWKALEVARPGDVLVIATYGFVTTSTFGEFVALTARARGLAGIVCDGMCRDLAGIRASGLPAFVVGSVPSSPGKDGPGEIGGPVVCGGLPVHAGDLVIGDDDGVVVVPLADAPRVLERLAEVRAKEAKMLAAIEAGQLKPAWLDEVLAAKGCEVIS